MSSLNEHTGANTKATNKLNDNNNKEEPSDFPYPIIWRDDTKVKLMLSSFRPKNLDPDGYDTKMRFWEDIISNYCIYCGRVAFCKRDLLVQFTKGDRVPACLDVVLLHMQQMKKLRLRSEYEYDPENTWRGWVTNGIFRKPLLWGWQSLKNTIITEDEYKQSLVEWVHIDVLKLFCNKVEREILDSNRGKLLHFDDFKKLCNDHFRVMDDTLVLISHKLNCQRKLGVDYKSNTKQRVIHLVKIPNGNHDFEITDPERAIHNLQVTQRTLFKQIEELENEIKTNDNKARQYVKENKRQLAKTYLRKKHLLERNHEKRSLALHNIDALLSNVDEAQHSGVVLDAYKIGSKALSTILDESGLTYDNVDEVLSDVRDTMEQHNEIQNTISNANLTDSMLNSTVDEDLDRELSDLLREVKNVSPHTRKEIPTTINTSLPNNNNKSHQIVISDAELLEMLDSLEVEDSTLSNVKAVQQPI